MIEKLKKLQSEKSKYTSSVVLANALRLNPEMKASVNELYYYYFGKKISGCDSCYHDAYIQLVTLTDEKMKQKEDLEFEMRNGALLTDPVNGDRKLSLTSANISNDLVMYHLKHNFDRTMQFLTKYPEDIVDRLEKWGKNEAADKAAADKAAADKAAADKAAADKAAADKAAADKAAADKAAADKAAVAKKTKNQIEAENAFVADLVESLKAGADIDFVRETTEAIEKVGSEKLTPEFLNALLERAQKEVK